MAPFVHDDLRALDLHAPLAQALSECLEAVVIPGGDVVFRQGEPADALYFVVSGTIGISYREAGGDERRLARVQPPDTVGEMAILSDAPRSATATALRDSRLLRLSRRDFEALTAEHPATMLYFARLLSDRLRVADAAPHLPHAPRAIAVVPITPGADAVGVAHELAATVDGRACVVAERPADADEGWFHRVEADAACVFYASPAPAGDWAAQCLRHADHVLLVARAGEAPLPMPNGLVANGGWRRCDLVVTHEATATIARGVLSGTDAPAVELRLHLRRGHCADAARVARTVRGCASALVLSGGGARGFAHVGVVRALREAGRTFDLVGGTSFGAAVAAGLALGWCDAELEHVLVQSFVRMNPLNDYTLPLVALTRGRKIEKLLDRFFGTVHIEELWLPFFCVSSNLTTGRTHVHRVGPVARALRASVAIPGLVPPVLAPDGVLVDGAMMNNLPVDEMAAYGRGRVIAVDVANDAAFSGQGRRRGWRARALRALLGIDANAPDIAQVLIRAATVASHAQAVEARQRATIVIRPPLAEIDLRAWTEYGSASRIGYEHTRRLLARHEAGL